MMPGSQLVDDIRVTVVQLPTDGPEADGTLAWSSTTCVVVEARSGERTGTGWTYGPAACGRFVSDVLAPEAIGSRVLDPRATWWRMVRRIRNATRSGVAGYALSAVDVALWDLEARCLDVSLADLLGRVRAEVPAYGSGGFTTYDDERTAEQLERWRSWGARAVKIKIGESDGTATERDLDRIAFVHETLGPGVDLMVDANGGYLRKQAVRLARRLPELGVTWFEEPVSSDDLEGLRQVREASDVDIAAGEYGGDLTYFRRMCAAESVDCLQIDATRCGGVTGWSRAVVMADAFGVDVSSHCAPYLHRHLAAATRHLRHVEYFHDHVRLEHAAFEGADPPVDGCLAVSCTGPGHGIALRPDLGSAIAALGGSVERC